MIRIGSPCDGNCSLQGEYEMLSKAKEGQEANIDTEEEAQVIVSVDFHSAWEQPRPSQLSQ